MQKAYVPREIEIIPPTGRPWRIRHRTFAERLQNGLITTIALIASGIVWAIVLAPLAHFVFTQF